MEPARRVCVVVCLALSGFLGPATASHAASARHHGTAPSLSAGASRVSATVVPATASSPIKGARGDLVYGGAKGQTIAALWTRPDRRRLRGFMFFTPSVQCTGGFQSVDLRRVHDVVALSTHGRTAGRLFGDQVKRRSFNAASLQTIAYGGAAEVSGTIEESIDGTIRGDHVSGHYSAKISLFDAEGLWFATCTATRVAWAANSGAGRYFAGGTWANPLYVERSADGKRVSAFRIGTGLTCTGGRWDTFSHFRGIPVTRQRFSIDSDTNDPWGNENLHDVTGGRGTFSGDTVRGTFAEDATFSDASGAPTDHCIQRRIRWSAFSSAQ